MLLAVWVHSHLYPNQQSEESLPFSGDVCSHFVQVRVGPRHRHTRVTYTDSVIVIGGLRETSHLASDSPPTGGREEVGQSL